MGKKKAPQLPMYEKYADNQYQAYNRNLSEDLGNWLNTNYSSIDPTSESFNSGSKGYAGNLNNFTLTNLTKNYTSPTNSRLGSQYNTSLYAGDLNSILNSDLQTRLDSSNAAKYGERINDYYKTNLANLMARYIQYVPSGEDINAADQINNNIINQNKDREYQNRLMREAQKGNPLNIVKNAVKGGVSGLLTGGPLGALTGAAQGGIGSALNEYTDFGGIFNGLMKGLNAAGGLGATYSGFMGK